jgi:hypothetical protein
MLNFKLLHLVDERSAPLAWVAVKLHKDRRTFRRFRVTQAKDTGRSVASFVPACPRSGRRRNPFLGTIHLNRRDCDIDTISHECTHASEEYRARFRIRREEALAYGVGKLTSKICRGLLKAGVKIWLCDVKRKPRHFVSFG